MPWFPNMIMLLRRMSWKFQCPCILVHRETEEVVSLLVWDLNHVVSFKV